MPRFCCGAPQIIIIFKPVANKGTSDTFESRSQSRCAQSVSAEEPLLAAPAWPPPQPCGCRRATAWAPSATVAGKLASLLVSARLKAGLEILDIDKDIEDEPQRRCSPATCCEGLAWLIIWLRRLCGFAARSRDPGALRAACRAPATKANAAGTWA